MKNKFKYFVLYPLMILIVILTLTYDVKDLISLGVRIPFGEAYWKDSLTNGIVTNKSIRMQPGDSLYYNGVTVTSGTGGGGISGSDNITFTGRDSTTDLWRFGDSVRFYEHVLFKDTLKVSNAIAIFDSAKINVDISMGRDSGGINWTAGGLSQIYQLPSPANILAFKQNEFDFLTKKNTQLLTIDSVNGIVILKIFNGLNDSIVTESKFYFNDSVKISNYANITGNAQVVGNLNVGTNITALGKVTADSLLGIGYYITDINAANIASGKIDSARIPNTAKIDTANFAHTGSGITEIFNSIVTFATTVTFAVSPVFSALVNFANGITVTGTATFNGDLVPTSWVKTQSSATKDQYIKDKILRMPISSSTSAGTVTYTLHGLGRSSIRDFDVIIRDDSTGRFAKSSNIGLEGGSWAQGSFSTWGLNDTAVWFRRTANAYNLIGDTAFFHIIYADTTR